MNENLKKHLGENLADLDSLKKKRSGEIPTLLTNFKLDQLIDIKQNKVDWLQSKMKENIDKEKSKHEKAKV